MDDFAQADLKSLHEDHQFPCVSLYMPTHVGGNAEDVIRFRRMLASAKEGLAEAGLDAGEAKAFLQPLESLLENAAFWRGSANGLAAFLGADFFRVYRLPQHFDERVEVGGLFQIVPLLPLIQGDGRFFVLGLSQGNVSLWRGTCDRFEAVELKGVPRNIDESLRTHDRDKVLSVHARRTSGGGWGAIYSGQGVGVDDAKDDVRRYFQAIDLGLHTTLRGERAPLVLAGVEYLLPIFRDVNSYPHVVNEEIRGNPDRLSMDDLHARAWKIVEPLFQEERKTAVDLFRRAAAHGRATCNFDRVVGAAYRGEVATLFVSLNDSVSGAFDPQSGAITRYEKPSPGAVDLLNFAAVHMLRHGKDVYALEPDAMPTEAPLAAIDHLPAQKHGRG